MNNFDRVQFCLEMTQNCDAGKAENCGAIFRGVARFCWQNGWFLLKENRGAILCSMIRFLDKAIVLWVIRLRRGTIFTDVTRF